MTQPTISNQLRLSHFYLFQPFSLVDWVTLPGLTPRSTTWSGLPGDLILQILACTVYHSYHNMLLYYNALVFTEFYHSFGWVCSPTKSPGSSFWNIFDTRIPWLQGDLFVFLIRWFMVNFNLFQLAFEGNLKTRYVLDSLNMATRCFFKTFVGYRFMIVHAPTKKICVSLICFFFHY